MAQKDVLKEKWNGKDKVWVFKGNCFRERGQYKEMKHVVLFTSDYSSLIAV